MAHALSKGDSDLSAVPNGMFLDAEPGRSSEVSLCACVRACVRACACACGCVCLYNAPNCSMHRHVVAVAMLVGAAQCLHVVHGHAGSQKCPSICCSVIPFALH